MVSPKAIQPELGLVFELGVVVVVIGLGGVPG